LDNGLAQSVLGAESY
jgi:hypothetical protein